MEETLRIIQDTSFQYAEIPVHGVDVVCNGKINRPQVRAIQEILKRFNLKYTVHAPDKLNLMDSRNFKLHMEIFKSGIEFANAIDSEIFVYHNGKMLLQEVFNSQKSERDTLFNINSSQEINRLKDIEVNRLQELALFARSLGVTITMENANPGWTENYFLKSGSFSLDTISQYNYGVKIDSLVEQVRKVNQENVAIALDFGHAYIASRFYRFNYLDSIKSALPYIKHVHLHDCFGKFNSTNEEKDIDLIPFGLGDMHMPLGWGEIPIDGIFRLLRNYDGIICLELKPRYKKFYAHSLQMIKEFMRN